LEIDEGGYYDELKREPHETKELHTGTGEVVEEKCKGGGSSPEPGISGLLTSPLHTDVLHSTVSIKDNEAVLYMDAKVKVRAFIDDFSEEEWLLAMQARRVKEARLVTQAKPACEHIMTTEAKGAKGAPRAMVAGAAKPAKQAKQVVKGYDSLKIDAELAALEKKRWALAGWW
jgi:hypothetical protein